MSETKKTSTQTQATKKKVDCIKVSNFDEKRFTLEPIFDDPKSKITSQNQLLSFPRYDYSKTTTPEKKMLTFATDVIELSKYGVSQPAKLDKDGKSKFGKQLSVSDEAWIRLPLDPKQQSCMDLKKMCSSLDTIMVKNKEDLFKGTKFARFSRLYSNYTNIVRQPQEVMADDDEEGSKKKKSDEPSMEYIKFKFAVDYESSNITTVVFLHEDGYPKKQNVKTLQQLRELCPYRSKVRLIVQASKVWLAKSGENNVRKYGLTFKVKQLDILEQGRVSGGGDKESFDDYMFDTLDDDTQKESKTEEPTKSVVSEPVKKQETKEESDNEDEEEDEEESEEESEEEEPKKPAPKKGSKGGKK